VACRDCEPVYKLTFTSLSPCGRGCLSKAKAGEGLVHQTVKPLTQLNLAMLDFATLSHKGRGEKAVFTGTTLEVIYPPAQTSST
jgi:hypothetical protein